MTEENRSWGYDRIVGALANLGHEVSDQTVGNVLRRNGIPPAPARKRTTTWAEFIRIHLAVLVGTDISTAGLIIGKLVTYLHAVFHLFGNPQHQYCAYRQLPQQAADAANGSERYYTQT